MDCEKLELGSKCTIVRAEELHAKMESLLQTGHDVEIDASTVEQCDTAALQLLLAFHKELENLGRDLTWKSPTDATLSAAKLIGLDKPLGLTSH